MLQMQYMNLTPNLDFATQTNDNCVHTYVNTKLSLPEIHSFSLTKRKGQRWYKGGICLSTAECDEKPISILETGTRISVFQSHVLMFLEMICFFEIIE